MNDYLLNLIVRMSDSSYADGEEKIDGVFESGKTIYSIANEEARQLIDLEYLDELYRFLSKEPSLDEKQNAIFIIGQIARNTKNENATKFLIERLKIEKNKELLVTILGCLPDLYKPKTIDISPIVKLIDHRNYHVRGKAYEALTNTEHPVEQILIDKLKSYPKTDDIRYIIYALLYVGTKDALEPIQLYLKSRNHSINNSAIGAYTAIMLRENFAADVIAKKARVNVTYVERIKERLDLLTRPG